MMNLVIEFPKNLVTISLLKLRKIPCFCKVAHDFEISFHAPAPEVTGKVSEWDEYRLNNTVCPGVGGKYAHYTNGLITLKEINLNFYQIVELFFFDRRFGWCPVIQGGDYAPPLGAYDPENYLPNSDPF